MTVTKPIEYQEALASAQQQRNLERSRILDHLALQQTQLGPYPRSTVTPIYNFGKEQRMTKKRRIKSLERTVEWLEKEVGNLRGDVEPLKGETRTLHKHSLMETHPLNVAVDKLMTYLGLEVVTVAHIPTHLEIRVAEEAEPQQQKKK